MKRIVLFIMVAISLLVMVSCGETKTLHCDYCNKEVNVAVNSNMEEDWIIYCEECNDELFGDDPLLGTKS